jgi:hypothetical protein
MEKIFIRHEQAALIQLSKVPEKGNCTIMIKWMQWEWGAKSSKCNP